MSTTELYHRDKGIEKMLHRRIHDLKPFFEPPFDTTLEALILLFFNGIQ